jgi:orotate phosphoribosyltransferase
MKFNQKKFNKFIIDNNVIGFFKEPVTLKSGRTSHWYANFRNITEDAYLTEKLSDYVIAFTKTSKLSPDSFYGVPEGATKLAIITQYKWAKSSKKYALGTHALPMGRGKPKEHGNPKDRFFLGMPKGKTIILEDVTTTGNSLLATVDTLKHANTQITAAFGLTNRMELRDDGKTVSEALEEKGVAYHALSNALELLPQAYQKLAPGEEVAEAIEEEFRKYGAAKLNLR